MPPTKKKTDIELLQAEKLNSKIMDIELLQACINTLKQEAIHKTQDIELLKATTKANNNT
jgi:hypothetical protein